MKMFRAFADEKELVRIRNKFVAHNFDDFESSSYAEGNRLLTAMFGETLADHLEFLNGYIPKTLMKRMSNTIPRIW